MQEKRVGDLIKGVKEPVWINSGSLIVEAVSLLGRQLAQGGADFLLVVRQKKDHREILGMITLNEIIAKLEPPALSDESGLPIFWQGQLTEQARELFGKEVDTVMVEPEYALNRNSTLMEALYLMNSRDTRILVVVSGNQVLGLLTREHLLKEIIRLTGD